MRILDDEIAPKWVPDEENPADFLTKWLPGPKLRASLAYVCNSAVWHGLEKLRRDGRSRRLAPHARVSAERFH